MALAPQKVGTGGDGSTVDLGDLTGSIQFKSECLTQSRQGRNVKTGGGILSTDTPFTVWRLVFRAYLSSFFASVADFA